MTTQNLRSALHAMLKERLFKPLFGLVFLLPLASCYVPDNFAAEIRITKAGGYGITYTGELIWAPLYGQIVRGELDQDAAAEQIAGFRADLEQDGYFTRVASLGQGRFEVSYDRRGAITRTQQITFVRRNARIFKLEAAEDGTVRFEGRSATALQADQLEAINLRTRGLFRIVTDAPVSFHNATAVRPSPLPGYVMYDWRMTSFRDPAPRLVLQLDGTLPTSPGA